jgi:hypothetical protein
MQEPKGCDLSKELLGLARGAESRETMPLPPPGPEPKWSTTFVVDGMFNV